MRAAHALKRVILEIGSDRVRLVPANSSPLEDDLVSLRSLNYQRWEYAIARRTLPSHARVVDLHFIAFPDESQHTVRDTVRQENRYA